MPHRLVIAAAFVLLLAACGPAPGDVSPLSIAARTGDVKAITRLVAAGADVNGTDPGSNRWTPLLHAIHKRQRGSVNTLIALGADVHRGPAGPRTHETLTPLLMAVAGGQADIVRRLLDAGADPRRDGPEIFPTAVAGGALSDIDNPLFGSCNAEVVRALLEKDPKLRLPSGPRGALPRLFARLNGCDEAIRLSEHR